MTQNEFIEIFHVIYFYSIGIAILLYIIIKIVDKMINKNYYDFIKKNNLMKPMDIKSKVDYDYYSGTIRYLTMSNKVNPVCLKHVNRYFRELKDIRGYYGW